MNQRPDIRAGQGGDPAAHGAAYGSVAAVGWLALWLLLGPVVILLLAHVVFRLSLGYLPESIHTQQLWHVLSGVVAVVLARSLWKVAQPFPVFILVASAVVGILVARNLGGVVPRWLLDDPGEGANLHSPQWVIIPQTATLFLVCGVGWLAALGVLRGFIWYSRRADA